MTQPRLSRLEGGGATPTVPLLAHLADALDADLDTTPRPRRSSLTRVLRPRWRSDVRARFAGIRRN